MASESKKERSIEDIFCDLDKIIDKMDKNNCSIEESFKLYEKGKKLIKMAKESIDKKEKKLIILEGEENEEGV